MRPPDEIMADLERHTGVINSVMWEIIEDILDSVKLACTTYDATAEGNPPPSTFDEIYSTVSDYVTNHYGD